MSTESNLVGSTVMGSKYTGLESGTTSFTKFFKAVEITMNPSNSLNATRSARNLSKMEDLFGKRM
ncbi:MAG: hypothetical protein IPN18_15015 [Ignavibacteriales bacterium]|nr:hypothetical protein [Ignavibacteriales bacterium]